MQHHTQPRFFFLNYVSVSTNADRYLQKIVNCNSLELKLQTGAATHGYWELNFGPRMVLSNYFYFMCMGILFEYTMCIPSVQKGQKRVLDPVCNSSFRIVSHHVGAGNAIRVLQRIIGAFNH